ncbi:MAG: FixH family protein [Halofilum sp. (in: g-proteobacteria)]|nr:FixH family protein [Halofilum sp. (in: g-proteobacteria)]
MSAQPWYRHPWVWALFVPPVAAIVFWTVIITVFAGPPSLVVDDYAKIGLSYQQERDRDAAAADLGVQRAHASAARVRRRNGGPARAGPYTRTPAVPSDPSHRSGARPHRPARPHRERHLSW